MSNQKNSKPTTVVSASKQSFPWWIILLICIVALPLLYFGGPIVIASLISIFTG
jgi:hypothetical protein